MTPVTDVIVVGGGINGASVAHALAARGVRRVTLVDQGATGSGASGRSSAVIRMHYTNEHDARLAWASFPTFRHWSEVMGGPPVFTPTGFLALVGPEYAEHLRRNVAMLRAIGVNTTALSPADARVLQPFLNVDDVGAVAHEPESGYASPAEAVAGTRRRARELGATILEWTRVTRILATASRVVGVETETGRIEAGAVVIAAGAWAPALCRGIGLELPARAKAVDTAVVARPASLAAPHMILMDCPQATYFRPEAGGLTIVGVPCQAWDIDPGTLDSGLPAGAAAEAARLLVHRIPAMEHATLARGYRAFDLYSADRHAILGAVDGLDGLYLATASSGTGFKVAPAVGACLAELIVDGEARTADIRAFALRRFAEGRPLQGPFPYAPPAAHAGWHHAAGIYS